MAEAQAAGMMLPPLVYGEDEPLDQFEGVASSPEEWRRLIEQMRGTVGPQSVQRGPGATTLQPGMVPQVPPPVMDTGGMEAQGMAPSEMGTTGVEGSEGADIFNRMGMLAARAAEPGNRRAILRGIGGTVGAAAGFAGGGPVGGGLGMVTGDYAGQVAANWLDTVYNSNAPAEQKPALAERMIQDMSESAKDSGIATGVGWAAGKALPIVWQNVKQSNRLFNRLMRLPPNSREFLFAARDLDVDIGVANLTGTQGLGGGAMNVFSRMPFMGTTAKDLASTQAKRLVAAQNQMFGKVAPSGQSMDEISEAAVAEGTRRFEQLAVRVQNRVEHAGRVGQEAGPILSTAAIKAESQRIKVAAQQQLGGAANNLPKNIKDVLRTLDNWPERISTVDLYNMRVWLERNANAHGNLQYPAITRLRGITDQMLSSSNHPAARLMREAERFTADSMTELSTDIAKKFGHLPRNQYIGDFRYRTNMVDADQLVTALEKATTVNKVNELRAVIGDAPIQAMARMRLDQAWEAGMSASERSVGGLLPKQQLAFDSARFNKVLGLDNMGSQRAKATQEMLRGTGVDIGDLQRLAMTAEAVANAPLGDTSTFVMRAAVLRGGVGGLTSGLKHAFALSAMGGGAVAGGPAGGSLATAIILRTIVNAGLGKLMQPGLVQRLTKGIDPASDAQTRIGVLFHLFETRPNLVIDTNAP